MSHVVWRSCLRSLSRAQLTFHARIQAPGPVRNSSAHVDVNGSSPQSNSTLKMPQQTSSVVSSSSESALADSVACFNTLHGTQPRGMHCRSARVAELAASCKRQFVDGRLTPKPPQAIQRQLQRPPIECLKWAVKRRRHSLPYQ